MSATYEKVLHVERYQGLEKLLTRYLNSSAQPWLAKWEAGNANNRQFCSKIWEFNWIFTSILKDICVKKTMGLGVERSGWIYLEQNLQNKICVHTYCTISRASGHWTLHVCILHTVFCTTDFAHCILHRWQFVFCILFVAHLTPLPSPHWAFWSHPAWSHQS